MTQATPCSRWGRVPQAPITRDPTPESPRKAAAGTPVLQGEETRKTCRLWTAPTRPTRTEPLRREHLAGPSADPGWQRAGCLGRNTERGSNRDQASISPVLNPPLSLPVRWIPHSPASVARPLSSLHRPGRRAACPAPRSGEAGKCSPWRLLGGPWAVNGHRRRSAGRPPWTPGTRLCQPPQPSRCTATDTWVVHGHMSSDMPQGHPQPTGTQSWSLSAGEKQAQTDQLPQRPRRTPKPHVRPQKIVRPRFTVRHTSLQG